MYRTDRSTIDGINGALKTATIPIDDATKRRRRGYTAQYLLLTMLVATENVARIQSFRDALLAHPTEEAYERHVAAKLKRKVNRKAKEAHRANSWDAFQLQSAAQREANARVAR